MLGQLSCTITAVVACVTIAAAQQAAGAAGTWNATTMMGPKDSVVAGYLLKGAADGKSATIKVPRREPIPTRVRAQAGDSNVTEDRPDPGAPRFAGGEGLRLLFDGRIPG